MLCRCDCSQSDDNSGDADVLDIHSPQTSGYPYLHSYPQDRVRPVPPSYPAPNHWHSAGRHPNVMHFPAYGSNGWRGSYPIGHYTHAAPNSSVMWNTSQDQDVTSDRRHPPSPCTVTHPPTPPPSSVDTANLDAAIEVICSFKVPLHSVTCSWSSLAVFELFLWPLGGVK